MWLHGGSRSAEVRAVKPCEENPSLWSDNVSCEEHMCEGSQTVYYFSLTTLLKGYPRLCENGQEQINSEKKHLFFSWSEQ